MYAFRLPLIAASTAARTTLRSQGRRSAAAAVTSSLRSFSVAPNIQDSVIVDRYLSAPNKQRQQQQMQQQQQQMQVVDDLFETTPTEGIQHSSQNEKRNRRLPNDVRERNALYSDESERQMGGIRAEVRHDWTKDEIAAIYTTPFVDLMYRASTVHRMYWDASEVQQCTLLSIKTGGCTEDCSYCSQSTRHKTFVKPTPTLKVQQVLEAARAAKDAGSTRFCMGAAWRELGNKQNAFGHILDMVRGVNALGLEVCCTLGMLNSDQARQLKQAGLTAYNHNLDTSPEHYPNVITTRTYQDRLDTIANVRDAGISVCCGGILGLGEQEADRVGLLHVLATLPEHPESVPINALVSVQGTPLGDADDDNIGKVDAFDMARMIATARIVMPRTMVRLSAGRLSFSAAEQFLMFQAGANSIFNGDKLLTTANPDVNADQALFDKLGLKGKPAHKGPLLAPAEEHGKVVIVTKVQGSGSSHDAQEQQQQPLYA
jgi:biotin synthase